MSGESGEGGGWITRLRAGLKRSSTTLADGLAAIFAGGKVDPATVQELEDLLIMADLGPATAARLARAATERQSGGERTGAAVTLALADEITQILEPLARPLEITAGAKPHVILVVGVNGTGKTTTIGKLAHVFKAQGHSVMIAAGDTFRAAAVDQLRIWAARAGARFFGSDDATDAAAVAFDAMGAARDAATDVLLVDTAGRLHNKSDLMAELEKIIRVMRKLDPAAPHDTLLVLDATTGQNAHAQAEVFKDITNVSGLVITKLDGSAKGGVLVALAERFALPVYAIGVGEGIDDLQPFTARDYARSLLGLDGDGDVR
ncbi:MAG: signal recognition particle-docking protein FtsY [Alphaproteobacteria bacterium]|nr:signal recognition particle-docking protein FtsY [Pseudomonadota bacterium]TDI65998.1 MAG: signal recognition particle-docking protein FtsY [Alphaproteobacteria bacterium]